MRVTIVSPGIYTYGSLVLGGILTRNGHEVVMTKNLESTGEVTLLSLFSTLQLFDEKIISFTKGLDGLYIGGPVGLVPEIVLGELKADGVVMGEGEGIVSDLVEKGPEGLDGVAYFKDGKIVKSKPKPMSNLDHPIPLIPDDLKSQNVRGANIYIETHRGCLGNCAFCQVPRFFGRKIRSRSLENVIEEVKALKAKGIERVAVSGGTGNLFGYKNEVNKKAFIELLEALSEILGRRNLSVPDMRVDLVDEEILDAVKKYTIGWVFFGLESGSQKILDGMKKGVTVDRNMEAISLARRHGVKVGGSFIVGYPKEDDKAFQETKEFIEEAMLDDVFVSIAEPIPGTPLAIEALKVPEEENPLYRPHEGEYKALKLSEAEARCLDLMIQGEMCKPVPRMINDGIFASKLDEAKLQGKDIRNVMGILHKYKNYIK